MAAGSACCGSPWLAMAGRSRCWRITVVTAVLLSFSGCLDASPWMPSLGGIRTPFSPSLDGVDLGVHIISEAQQQMNKEAHQQAVLRSVTVPPSVTVPLLLWTPAGHGNKQALLAVASDAAFPSVSTMLDRMNEQLQKKSSTVFALFVDENVSTTEFLRLSGGFQRTTATNYTALGDFVRSSTAPPDLDFVIARDYAASTTFLAVFNLMTSIASKGVPVTYVTDLTQDSTVMDASIKRTSYDATPFETSTTGSLVVVNMEKYRGSLSKGDFIMQLAGKLGTADMVFAFTSTWNSQTRPSVALWSSRRRTLAAVPKDTTAEELRIQPFQVSALLTLGSVLLMILMVVGCMVTIDTPLVFEDKTLDITKEY